MQNLQPLINSLQGFAQKRLNFERPPKLFFKQDTENAKDIFGKTAYYDPNQESITLFTLNRHPKDILRSFAHELVHHCQNLRGDLSQEKCGKMDTGYTQENDHMREMEREAYEQGSLCFRDWEDGIKIRIAMKQENKTLKENKKMVKRLTKELIRESIKKILREGAPRSGMGYNSTATNSEDFQQSDEVSVDPPGDPSQHPLPAGGSVDESIAKDDGCGCDDNDHSGHEAGCGCDDNDHSGHKEIEVSIQEEENEEESEKIQTPEQENALYESRFNKRNEEVFNKLKKLWVK